MRIRNMLSIAVGVLFVCILAPRGEGQTRLPGPSKEQDERLVTPLINAGIALNEVSLVLALKNDDSSVAASAALALARFPKTRNIVRALESAITDDREIVGMLAGYSLLDFNERAWVSKGVNRLSKMHNPLLQIQFAGLLARAGSGAGWPIVKSRILEERFAPSALENVEYFDGRIGPTGQPIKVVKELEALLTRAPQSSRSLIEHKLTQIRTKSR